MPTHDNRAPRAIRSYVLRAGRITAAQERALAEHWPRFGVDFQRAALDLPQLFGRVAPCTLEIGFGNGEQLLERARSQPQHNFLGVEVHRPGVGHLLLAAAAAALGNLRVIEHDAVEVLQQQISPDSLAEVQLLFPDPWPKKRHHKRRLVQPGFARLVAERLIPGGALHVATDWEPYAQDMLLVLNGCELLRNADPQGGFIDPSHTHNRHATRFERRGERLGHKVFELLFRRA
ncbi:MAG: tRNA (guanosine(46)-N7)-methyltransferase TrmB [Steroidobacteraceae bacterium]